MKKQPNIKPAKAKRNQIETAIKRNATFERTQIVIDKAISELIKELERLPSLQEISDRSKLSYSAVWHHHQETGFSKFSTRYRGYLNKVLTSITKEAIRGDMQAVDRYMELVFDRARRQEITGKDGKDLVPFKEMSTVSDAALLAALQNPEKVKKDA